MKKENARIDITNDYIDLLEQVIDYRQANTKKLVTGISCHSEIHPNIKRNFIVVGNSVSEE